uniref:UBC core domain-containing protein n=1 Tax=Arcella intermedia TaxID=1963864 RepID=A0A6B2KY89_9EUKA
MLHDFKEVRKTPEYKYQFSAVPQNDNIFIWHANLRGSVGTPYENIIFHLTLEFNDHYPISPPQVKLCTYLYHPNVFSSYICLDMLEKGSWASSEETSKLYTGWSSAYTVSSILLQLQEFFSNNAYSSMGQSARSADSFRTFKCTCGHSSSNIYPSLVQRPKSFLFGNELVLMGSKFRSTTKKTAAKTKIGNAVSLPVISENGELPVKIENYKISLRFSKGWATFDNLEFSHTVSPTDEGVVFSLSNFQQPPLGWHGFYEFESKSLLVPSSDNISFSLLILGESPNFFNTTLQYDFTNITSSDKKDIKFSKNDYAGNTYFISFMKEKDNYFMNYFMFYVKLENLLGTNKTDPRLGGSNSLFYQLGDFSVFPHEIILLILSMGLSLYDVASLSLCCRGFYDLTLDPIFWSSQQRAQEIVCFHTKMSFEHSTLGYGINIERYSNTNTISGITSPLDLISYEAYKQLGVRKSVWKEPFSGWLPVYINRKHALRAVPLAKESLSQIHNSPSFNPQYALTIFPKLMNTMVVMMMSGNLHASMKALEGYCQFHRFFLHFVEEYPALLGKIEGTIEGFINDPNLRIKKVVPNLGEFLAYLTVTDRFGWEDIREAYLSENFDRNVKWIIEKKPHLAKPSPTINNRVEQTFECTTTSLRLLMFHVYFLCHIASPPSAKYKGTASAKVTYDTLYGQPTPAMKEALQFRIKQILKVSSWTQFFDAVEYPIPSVEELNMWLCESVQRSEWKRYHRINNTRTQNRETNNRKKNSRPTLASDEYDKYY